MQAVRHPPPSAPALVDAYGAVRQASEQFAAPLAIEDYMVQAVPDASPTKWHLAHVSWFFETFLLRPHLSEYRPIDERFLFLFNSYYNAVGPQHSRPHRGVISRPTVAEVYEYRKHVDDEDEWEHHASPLSIEGHFVDDRLYHPVALDTGSGAATGGLRQMYGDVWEWTSSAFLPYPGFRPLEGAAGEYNGKFMMGQMVLRGGSVATPRNHMRASYRNFFYPPDRWQFMGFRLAEDLD